MLSVHMPSLIPEGQAVAVKQCRVIASQDCGIPVEDALTKNGNEPEEISTQTFDQAFRVVCEVELFLG